MLAHYALRLQRIALGAALVASLCACGGGPGAAVGVTGLPPSGGICPTVLPATPPVVLAYPGSGATNVPTAIGTLYFQTTNANSGAVGTGLPALTPAGSTTALYGTVLAAATMRPPGQTGTLTSYETSNVPTLSAHTTYSISLISAQTGCTVATNLGTFST